MMKRLAFALAAVGGVFAGSDSADASIASTRLATGLRRPIFLTAPAGDSRLFVVGQRGYIDIYAQDGSFVGTYLDIDALVPDVTGDDERGLLGLAFSPDYATDGLFYVNYTNLASNTVIARYKVKDADPDEADPTSAEILTTIAQPFTNHNGGRLAFSPIDGFLYIGMGDGGSAGDPGNRAQNLETLLGKILRIDVGGGLGSGYSVPLTNPFVGEAGLDEIWAYGVRNPWGVAFDPETGDLYMADVGQGSWEEVNVQPALPDSGGQNYGWRLMEGNHCFDPPIDCDDGTLTHPIHEYSHGGSPFRCSITGGFVYRGDQIPEIDGHYFFADWCSNQIWTLVWDGAGGTTEVVDRTAELVPDAGAIADVAGFGEDGFGELYILDRGPTLTSGELFKIVPSSVDVPPASSSRFGIRAAPNPFSGSTRLTIGVPSGERASVRILDTQGRLVRRLADGFQGGELTWDGLDEAAAKVSPGVYVVRVESDGRVMYSRLVAVR